MEGARRPEQQKLARFLIHPVERREERAEMKQCDPFPHLPVSRKAVSGGYRFRWVLELGLAVFIGLSALHLHQLLATAAP